MSEEQFNEETEVEGHKHGVHANEEPRDEAETNDEVEGHLGKGQRTSSPANLSANDEAEDEVEGHLGKGQRTSIPRSS